METISADMETVDTKKDDTCSVLRAVTAVHKNREGERAASSAKADCFTYSLSFGKHTVLSKRTSVACVCECVQNRLHTRYAKRQSLDPLTACCMSAVMPPEWACSFLLASRERALALSVPDDEAKRVNVYMCVYVRCVRAKANACHGFWCSRVR